jgi:exosortase/archaeosortase family protein
MSSLATCPVVSERSAYWPKFGFIFLQLFALLPVIGWFCKRLNDGSDEPLGLLTLTVALVLSWRDRKELWAGSQTRIFGVALLLISVLGIDGLPPMVRAGFAVFGIAICYGVHRRAGVMGLLLLSLPVAASMQFFLGYPLRVAAAEGAVKLLELGSLVVFRSGTQIELGGKIIGVDPACGGVRMLWHALVGAMALAAIHRLSWRATLLSGLAAIALVIPANIVRAALLAVKETGYFSETMLGHDGIGLLCFGIILLPLWVGISRFARPSCVGGESVPPSRLEIGLLACSAILVPVLVFVTPRTPMVLDLGRGPCLYTFGGTTLPLHLLPATDAEKAFARGFPGTLSSYRWGNDRVILRRVCGATRRLHPSRDCLRAAGFESTDSVTVRLGDGSEWARFQATRDGECWTVHERITSSCDGSSWTDVSAWYWSALRHRLNGPWQAETVISK